MLLVTDKRGTLHGWKSAYSHSSISYSAGHSVNPSSSQFANNSMCVCPYKSVSLCTAHHTAAIAIATHTWRWQHEAQPKSNTTQHLTTPHNITHHHTTPHHTTRYLQHRISRQQLSRPLLLAPSLSIGIIAGGLCSSKMRLGVVGGYA